MGFKNDEDEYYFEITSKDENKKGEKEIVKIYLDDLDEMEHVPGTQ